MLKTFDDMARRFRRPASGPTEYYQRPHTYQLNVGLARVCLAPGGIAGPSRLPAITLLIQADLSNVGVVVLGDANVTLGSGLQLDAGKAALFAPSMSPQQQPGTLGTGLTQFITEVPIDYRADVIASLGASMGSANPVRVVIDVADFYAIGTVGDMHLRIFWVESVKIPA